MPNHVVIKPAGLPNSKVNHFLQSALSAAVFSFYASVSYATGAPVTIGQWSASSGTINDTACAGVDVSCDLVFQEDGLRYEYIDTPDGRFSRMIVTDSGATGDISSLSFAIENYVPFLERASGSGAFELPNGDIAQGIASKQVIRDSELEFTADIQRGFARDLSVAGLTDEDHAANAWGTRLVQTTIDDDIENGFSVLVYNEVNNFPASSPDNDAVRGKTVDVWQTVTVTDTGEKQVFDSRSRSGYKGWNFFLCCTDSVTKGGSVTLDGTTVTWADGESVNAVWVGSDISGLFGYESVTGTSGTATQSSIEDVGPFDWQALDSDDMNWPINPWLDPPDSSRTSPPSL